MSDPILEKYHAKILSDGYHISGAKSSGYTAVVPYIVAWTDAFNFADSIMGATSSALNNMVQLRLGHRFPDVPAVLYADDFRIEPCGSNGVPLAPGTYGLIPGQFFTHGKVTVTYTTPAFDYNPSDDPNPFNQLDPGNPITMCEQSVKMSGKMRTRKGSTYHFTLDNSPVIGDVGVVERTATLQLKFPQIPFMPWQFFAPFIGGVNLNPLFLCPAQTLLFNGGDTQYTSLSNGFHGQMLVLEFEYDPNGWNKLPRPDDGTFGTVYGGVDVNSRIYRVIDLALTIIPIVISAAV